ncbi:UPF0602 protein C4orf47-like [Acipenser ruthenus]|uniref:Cilia-and flagella-associated protein 96 n=1 Tax=Acipenser ruthenus TaxID=7906 RepID=A0A444U5J1_ACIRT|nr:UPF0602 protein C4orf47-like [Acipenser ruthenus]
MPSEMKTDMERIGLFSEPTYITIGDKYMSPYNRTGSYYGTFSTPIEAMSALQVPKTPYKSPGKNVLTNPPKHGTGYGYHNLTLSKPYPYTADPYDREKQMRKTDNSSHRSLLKGGAFFLNLHPKDLFDSNPYKFDKPLPPVKKSGGKKPAVIPFKPSSPAKKIGGMKAGTFEVYPSHSADPFKVKTTKAITKNKEGRVFQPSPGPKSRPVKSVVIANIMNNLDISVDIIICLSVNSIFAVL